MTESARVKRVIDTRTTCPLCESRGVKIVVRSDHWAIRACQVCTNAWTDPLPGMVDYSSENFHRRTLQKPQRAPLPSLADLPPQWRHSLLLQADRLIKVLSPGARVLEIGCGEGLLLEELSRRGLCVVGIEPSVAASAAARDRNLDVYTGYFPDTPIMGSFDAIVMSHVLEHLPRPAETLAAIDRILSSGGYVLLVQTNWRGLIPRLRGRRWYAWVPDQHFWHFTPRGLMKLFQPLGWSIRAIEYSSLVHSPMLRPLADLASRVPGLGDQFQILAQTHVRRS